MVQVIVKELQRKEDQAIFKKLTRNGDLNMEFIRAQLVLNLTLRYMNLIEVKNQKMIQKLSFSTEGKDY